MILGYIYSAVNNLNNWECRITFWCKHFLRIEMHFMFIVENENFTERIFIQMRCKDRQKIYLFFSPSLSNKRGFFIALESTFKYIGQSLNLQIKSTFIYLKVNNATWAFELLISITLPIRYFMKNTFSDKNMPYFDYYLSHNTSGKTLQQNDLMTVL